MEIKINSIIPAQSHLQQVEVFGYNSKSQPGLEINGLNGKGRIIKEKITYLSKKRQLKYPLKRFVLCVEGEGLDKSQVEFLELPLLICFWSMAGILPLKRLDNCFAAAKVSLDGRLTMPPLTKDMVEIMEIFYRNSMATDERLLLLGSGDKEINDSSPSFYQHVDITTLLKQSVGGFSC